MRQGSFETRWASAQSLEPFSQTGMLRLCLFRMLREEQTGRHVVSLAGHRVQLRFEIALSCDCIFQVASQNALFWLSSGHSLPLFRLAGPSAVRDSPSPAASRGNR